MNGHTYLRTYRILMLLGIIAFFYTAFEVSVPSDSLYEEYIFDDLAERLFDLLKIG